MQGADMGVWLQCSSAEGELRGLSGWIKRTRAIQKGGVECVQHVGELTKKVWRKRRRDGGEEQADI